MNRRAMTYRIRALAALLLPLALFACEKPPLQGAAIGGPFTLVDKDGRTDILTPKGWLEAPADPRGSGEWTLHAGWEEKAHLGFLHVVDINGDKRADVLTTNAHDYGVFWLEQGADGTDGKKWTRRLIDAGA